MNELDKLTTDTKPISKTNTTIVENAGSTQTFAENYMLKNDTPLAKRPTKKVTKKVLTRRQQRFIGEYMLSGNATQSAIVAGYSENGARTTGSRLLTISNIKQELSRLRESERLRLQGSIEQSVRDYEEARKLAIKIKQPAAAVSAIRWRDGLFGLQSGDKQTEQTIIMVGPREPARIIDSKPTPILPEPEPEPEPENPQDED